MNQNRPNDPTDNDATPLNARGKTRPAFVNTTRALQVVAWLLAAWLLWLTLELFSPSVSATQQADGGQAGRVADFDFDRWRSLPIQEGRTKPFETAAAEIMRQISGRERFDRLDPVAIVMTWWLGAGRETSPSWDEVPFILCDHHGLRRIILHDEVATPANSRDIPQTRVTGKYISPAELRRSPGFDELLVAVARLRSELQGKAHLSMTSEQLKAEEVAKRLALYDAICGRSLTRLHRNAIANQKFLDVAELAATKEQSPEDALRDFEKSQTTSPDPLRVVGLGAAKDSGWFSFSELRILQRQPSAWRAFMQQRIAQHPFPDDELADALAGIQSLQTAFDSRDREQFAVAEEKFFSLLERLNGPTGSSHAAAIERELTFNRWQPFRIGWIAMLLAVAWLLVSTLAVSRAWLWLGIGCYVISLMFQAGGFAWRVSIAGRAPVANMYETVVFVAFLSAVFALVLESVYRRRVILIAGALVATLGLVLADQLPLALDPKISPMVPVLRTNFWLTVHVLTIVASYAGGTLAWGLGNITLGWLAFGRTERETLKTLSMFTYRAMQIAVLLLATGTFLGGCWAAESWGRFWGWDPKEVGALVALICYVIPLHARYIGWVQDFGLAVSAVICYASIILSWYVINFLLAAGLHSYGFSSGGATGVLWATVLNLEWVVIAALRYRTRFPSSSDEAGVAHA